MLEIADEIWNFVPQKVRESIDQAVDLGTLNCMHRYGNPIMLVRPSHSAIEAGLSIAIRTATMEYNDEGDTQNKIVKIRSDTLEHIRSASDHRTEFNANETYYEAMSEIQPLYDAVLIAIWDALEASPKVDQEIERIEPYEIEPLISEIRFSVKRSVGIATDPLVKLHVYRPLEGRNTGLRSINMAIEASTHDAVKSYGLMTTDDLVDRIRSDWSITSVTETARADVYMGTSESVDALILADMKHDYSRPNAFLTTLYQGLQEALGVVDRIELGDYDPLVKAASARDAVKSETILAVDNITHTIVMDPISLKSLETTATRNAISAATVEVSEWAEKEIMKVRDWTNAAVQESTQYEVYLAVRNIVVSPRGDENVMAFYSSITVSIHEAIQTHDQTVERIDYMDRRAKPDADDIICGIRIETDCANGEAVDTATYDFMLRVYYSLLPNNQHRFIYDMTRDAVEAEVVCHEK